MNLQRDTMQGLWRAQALEPGLYPVATPIGNLRDITLRALDILANCDLVLAEDTRKTRVLFDAYGITTPLSPYHDHNGAHARPGILEKLADGASVALVSDAGTPLISDPGYKLVREAGEAGCRVVAIPGASAVLAGLCVAGLATDRFMFLGFPPAKFAARQVFFDDVAGVDATLVFYEAARRLPQTLVEMSDSFGDREGVVARELTKTFEEVRRGRLVSLGEYYAQSGAPKGEVVVLVGPPGAGAVWDGGRVDAALVEVLDDLGVKRAAAEVAGKSGWSKNEVYARALVLKTARSDGHG